MRFVVSTVGTSILTNLINRDDPDEAKNWWNILRDSANLKQDELKQEAASVIATLADRAFEKLLQEDVNINRKISAELNGIYAVYEGRLSENSGDQHHLICTDTAQGERTGNLIAEFLREQGFTVSVETPEGLSIQDTDSFTKGTKQLIKWLDDTVPRPGSGYKVIFNLVGGFKSLQGYMQTFGAFYADEIVYIFEGSTDLIKIPRLPIQIDPTVIEKYLTEFALMAAGKLYPIEKLSGIPETLLELVDQNGATFGGLSAWGELIWHRTKSNLVLNPLLPSPQLEYQSSFTRECKSLNNKQSLDLQETLAKIAVVLEDKNITELNEKVSGLNFEKLQNSNVYTFRINDNYRVSCSEVAQNTLSLRHYGTHDDVYKNP